MHSGPHNPADPNDTTALRDWFAGMAMNGLFAVPRIPGELPRTPDDLALLSYRYADAMLRKRTEPPTTK